MLTLGILMVHSLSMAGWELIQLDVVLLICMLNVFCLIDLFYGTTLTLSLIKTNWRVYVWWVISIPLVISVKGLDGECNLVTGISLLLITLSWEAILLIYPSLEVSSRGIDMTVPVRAG